MKALILSDGIPGHFNQSKGVLTLLKESVDIEDEIIQLRPRVKFLRSPIKLIARALCKNLSETKAKIIISLYKAIKISDFDLIIAAGGNTAAYSAAICFINKIPNIQLGSPRGIHSSNFTAHLTIDRYFDVPNNIVLDITPNLYSPSLCKGAANKTTTDNECLLLIGGKGIGYSYDWSEWEALISNIINFTESYNCKITIVTSRRTDPKVEGLLKTKLKDSYSDESIWFHSGGANANLAQLFGNAAKIFVTEDSAMMISESISSGKKVTTLFPKSINSPIRYSNHIQKYRDLRLIDSQSINESLSMNVGEDNIEKINLIRSNLSSAILERIN